MSGLLSLRTLRLVMPALILVLASCGGDEEKVDAPAPKVYKKQESKSLAEHGTAATKEEQEAREEDSAARRARNKAIVALSTIMDRIESSEDAFDLAENIAAVLEHSDYAEEHTEVLSKHLTHADADVRATTLRVIAKIRRAAAKNELLAATKDEEDRVRATALALWRKVEIPDLSPAFTALDDFADDVQFEAVKTIVAGNIGAAGQDMLLTKAELVSGPAARVILEWAVTSKDKLGAKLDTLLTTLLDHADDKTRLEAVRAARDLEAKRRPIAGKMVEILGNDPDARVSGEAYEVLKGWIGASAPAYDPSADDDARYTAGQAWREWFDKNPTLFP